MPRAQKWNKSQTLLSTRLFFSFLFPPPPPFYMPSSELLPLTLSVLPPLTQRPSSFLLLLFISCFPHCCPSFTTLLPPPCSCFFSQKCFVVFEKPAGHIYKKAKQSDTAGSKKKKTYSLVPVIENSSTASPVSHSLLSNC